MNKSFYIIEGLYMYEGSVAFRPAIGRTIETMRESVYNMHTSLQVYTGHKSMEVCTASSGLGKELAVSNMKYEGKYVESLYYGSMCFEDGEDMSYLHDMKPSEAKKMIAGKGTPIGFKWGWRRFPYHPKSFFDWLYIEAVKEKVGRYHDFEYTCFTDIQSTPEARINPARALCRYAMLVKLDKIFISDDFDAFDVWCTSNAFHNYEYKEDLQYRELSDDTLIARPEEDLKVRSESLFRGMHLEPIQKYLYKMTPRPALTLDESWCVIYTDMSLDSLCAIEFLSNVYKYAYIVISEWDDGNVPIYIKGLTDAYSTFLSWFERVVLTDKDIATFDDDVSKCNCYLMSSATKINRDIAYGVGFKTVEGVIGDIMPGIEARESRDIQSYRNLFERQKEYNISLHTVHECEHMPYASVLKLSCLEEYKVRRTALGKSTVCPALSMVAYAVGMRGN